MLTCIACTFNHQCHLAAFQAWDTVQAVSSYVRGMLSSQAIMHGIGVGREVSAARTGCIEDVLHR